MANPSLLCLLNTFANYGNDRLSELSTLEVYLDLQIDRRSLILSESNPSGEASLHSKPKLTGVDFSIQRHAPLADQS